MNAMMSTKQDVRTAVQFSTGGDGSPIIIKSTEFFPLCGQSGVRGEVRVRRERRGGLTGQRQSAGLKFGSEGGLSYR